ncbi:MAG: hypothetical protein NZ889_00230 [Candidatus Pacearchaeota archaeon]|nr:hypothetical protein [Candidatus Pacearchaeota archaeon]
MLADKVIQLVKQGYSDAQIIKILREEGYTPKQINDAFNQAKIKLELNREIEIPKPEEKETSQVEHEENETFYDFYPAVQSVGVSDVEEIVSEILEDKWQEFRKKTTPFFEAVERIESLLKNFERKLERNEEVIKKLADAAKQKFVEHTHEIKTLKAEVTALRETFDKIMKPLIVKIKKEAGMLTFEEKDKGKKENKKSLDSLF